jgi:hypothetical protein
VIHYHDTDIVCLSTYGYMIQAVGPGYDAYSDIESALTPCQPDGAPSDLVVVGVDIDQAHLEWVDQSSNEDGFIVLRSPDVNDGWVEVGRVGAGVTAFTDTGLSLNRVYFYRVVAYNGGGQTDFSNLATAEMLNGVFLPLTIK